MGGLAGGLLPGSLSEGQIDDAVRQAVWAAVVASAPMLSAALVVGLAVGLLQALTSVQEMTLTFVPKLAAMLLVFWMSMAFMTATLVDLLRGTLMPMVAGG